MVVSDQASVSEGLAVNCACFAFRGVVRGMVKEFLECGLRLHKFEFMRYFLR